MVDEREYLKDALLTLHSQDLDNLCKKYSNLSVENQIAYGPATRFIGCQIEIPKVTDALSIDQRKRRNAARIMLSHLDLQDGEPKWSSHMLNLLWEAIFELPGSSLSDLFSPMYTILQEHQVELTKVVENFIKEITKSAKVIFGSWSTPGKIE